MRDIRSQKATEEKKCQGGGDKGQTPIFRLLFLSDFVHLIFFSLFMCEKKVVIYISEMKRYVLWQSVTRGKLSRRAKKKNILEKEERLRQSFLAGPLLLVNARYSTYKRIDTTYYSRTGTQYIPCKIFIEK